MNETLKTLKERRSCRAFTPEQIKADELDTIIEAGQYAPSGMNRQPTLFFAVQQKELRDKLSKLNAKFLGGGSDPFYGAPTVVIVLVKDSVLTGVEDGSLAVGNMLNAAHSIGVGGCWIHRAYEMFDCDEGKAILKEFGIDGSWRGVGCCILGYPSAAVGKAPERTSIVKIVK